MIFRGEVSKAPGNTDDPAQCCEILLFTEDKQTLEAIDRNDWLNQVPLKHGEGEANDDPLFEQNRPMTATKRFTEEEVKQLQRAAAQKPTSLFDERPQTKAIRRIRPPEEVRQEDSEPNLDLEDFKPEPVQRM